MSYSFGRITPPSIYNWFNYLPYAVLLYRYARCVYWLYMYFVFVKCQLLQVAILPIILHIRYKFVHNLFLAVFKIWRFVQFYGTDMHNKDKHHTLIFDKYEKIWNEIMRKPSLLSHWRFTHCYVLGYIYYTTVYCHCRCS